MLCLMITVVLMESHYKMPDIEGFFFLCFSLFLKRDISFEQVFSGVDWCVVLVVAKLFSEICYDTFGCVTVQHSRVRHQSIVDITVSRGVFLVPFDGSFRPFIPRHLLLPTQFMQL